MIITRSLLNLALCAVLLTLNGCPAAAVIANAFPQQVEAKYTGLAGQTVGVMVWADRGTRIDWPRIQLDTASAIQTYLKQAPPKTKELVGTTFPVDPRSIVRYQLDHPEIDAMPVTDFAADFGVTRLIYIEIEQFATRSQMALDMFRGSATATLKIIEIAPDRTARVAYEETNIRAIFPPKSRAEGVPVGRDDVMYSGTIKVLAQEIVNRLVTHEED